MNTSDASYPTIPENELPTSLDQNIDTIRCIDINGNSVEIPKGNITFGQSQIVGLTDSLLSKVNKSTGYIYLGVADTNTVPAVYTSADKVYYSIDPPVMYS